jgi:hypothetical protein
MTEVTDMLQKGGWAFYQLGEWVKEAFVVFKKEETGLH